MGVSQKHLNKMVKKCRRGFSCFKPDCPPCSGPATNNHVCNLNQELSGFNLTSVPTPPAQPAALHDRMISTLIYHFQTALQDNDRSEMEMAIKIYSKSVENSPAEFIMYDRTKLKRLNKLAIKLTETSIQTPNPLLPSPPPLIGPQTV